MQKFKFTVKDGDNEPIVIGSGRTALWDALDYCADLPNTPSLDAKKDFYWLYFAAKACGRLSELGVAEESGIDEAVRCIADSFDSVTVEDVKADADVVPLAGEPGE